MAQKNCIECTELFLSYFSEHVVCNVGFVWQGDNWKIDYKNRIKKLAAGKNTTAELVKTVESFKSLIECKGVSITP